MNQCATSPAISVHERMDGLELSVSNGGLGNGRHGILIAEGTQVFKQAKYLLTGRRDEIRSARTVAAAADPVLLIANDPRVFLEPCSGQESSMDFDQMAHIQSRYFRKICDGPRHRIDVAKNFLSGYIAYVVPEVARNFGAK